MENFSRVYGGRNQGDWDRDYAANITGRKN